MRKRDIVLGLIGGLALAAIVLPLAVLLLISAGMLLIPVVPLGALAGLAVLLLAAHSKQIDIRSPHMLGITREASIIGLPTASESGGMPISH